MCNMIMLNCKQIFADKNSKDRLLKDRYSFKKIKLQICFFEYLFICSIKLFHFQTFVALLHSLMYLLDRIPRRVSTRIKIFVCHE